MDPEQWHKARQKRGVRVANHCRLPMPLAVRISPSSDILRKLIAHPAFLL
jgi:hypothetical protein